MPKILVRSGCLIIFAIFWLGGVGAIKLENGGPVGGFLIVATVILLILSYRIGKKEELKKIGTVAEPAGWFETHIPQPVIKRCGNCHGAVSSQTIPGQICPYCSKVFEGEITKY